jgi:predicted DNA-binding transcriptional regulator AlpA
VAVKCAAINSVIANIQAARLLASQNGHGSTIQQAEVRALTVDEAAAKLGVTPGWLYRRGRDLGLATKLSDGTLRFSNVAIEAYIKAQTVSAASVLHARRRRKAET